MELAPVVSSNIAAVGYDNLQNILLVQFKGKEAVYAYQGVPIETYDLMMSSDSIGSFYARNIKKNYQSHLVGSEPDGS